MPQFKVLRPIELDGKLYLPESKDAPAAKASGAQAAPAKGSLPQPGRRQARSMSNGAVIPVDASGVIELTDAEAKEMTAGQVQQIRSQKAESRKQNKS
jgi:hypothetical protein